MSKDFLEVAGAERARVLGVGRVEAETELAEGDALLLLEHHAHVAEDAVRFDVQANAVQLRHF